MDGHQEGASDREHAVKFAQHTGHLDPRDVD
jgi:hypothetical protein